MLSWEQYKEPKRNDYKTKKQGVWSDNVYTFDCETTTLINYIGTWQQWDRELETFANTKCAITYIWMFGANDKTYYGRDIHDFAHILKAMSDPHATKVIYIHNLPFEWQNVILDLIDANKWHVVDMLARAQHKPIQFKIKELNIGESFVENIKKEY